MSKRLTSAQLLAVKLLAVPGKGGMTYEEIAKECDVCVNTLYNWRTKDKAFQKAQMNEANAIIRDRVADLNNAAVDEFLSNPDNAAMFRELMKVIGNTAEKHEITDNRSESAQEIAERVLEEYDPDAA